VKLNHVHITFIGVNNMKHIEMMDEIRNHFPKAVCGEQNGRWYVESGDGSEDPLISVHTTKVRATRSALSYVRKHCRKI
jgi:hypothetical protein